MNGLMGSLGAFASAFFDNFRQKELRRRLWIWFRLFAIAPVAGGAAFGYLIHKYRPSLPSLESLERIEPSLVTRVYDKDSVLVHEFYTERRIWTPVDRIPKLQKQAVFAIEDQIFYRHWGVDMVAIPSALMPALVGHRARGASTLTQQLAKNLFLSPDRKLARKLKEYMLAVEIERTYTKDEILEFYFNQVYLGGGAYGFQAAAQRYFSKTLDQLDAGQYALLAGMLQRPEAYRPDLYPEAARERRNVVLRAMKSQGYITRAQLKAALAEPVVAKPWVPQDKSAAYFVETIRQFMEKKWDESFIYNQGVNVYSTLDSRLQKEAESAMVANLHHVQVRIRYSTARALGMSKYLRAPVDTIVRHWDKYYPHFDSAYLRPDSVPDKEGHKRFPDSLRYRHAQSAVLVLDNETGAVRALVGGEDFEKSKYNRALQALRSPGSSFKPFVYAAAVDNGASPGDMLMDQPITIPDPVDSTKVWRPHNYDDSFAGPISLRRALYKSKNLPAIEVAMKYGLKTVVAYARKFGLTHNVPPVPSLGIGSCEATLMEMVSAYTAFPNGGVRPIPYFIEGIEDKNGQNLYRNLPSTQEVLRKETAWIMCTMMRDVNIHGTGAAIWASGFNYPSGGKTGTTNDYSDAWYIGFTKRYTAGIWVGADNHAPLGTGHTGADDAIPAWLAIMRYAHHGQRAHEFTVDFPKPEGVAEATTCQVSGLLAQGFCRATNTDYYLDGHQPTEPCQPSYHTKASQADVFSGDQKREKPAAPAKGDKRVRNTF